MAIFHLHQAIVSRGHGRSSVQVAAYICRENLLEDRTGICANYTYKDNDVVASDTLYPSGSKYTDITTWNALENYEDLYCENRYQTAENREKYKACAQTAFTIEAALPNELSLDTNVELVESFINERFVSKGLISTYAIHCKEGNMHVHMLVSRRAIGEDGQFVDKKNREICSRKELIETRNIWADKVNTSLEQEGFREKISSKSYKDLCIDFEPSKHEGWWARQLGDASDIVKKNREIFQENEQRIIKDPSIVIDYLNEKQATFTQSDVLKVLNKRVSVEENIEGICNEILSKAICVGENARGDLVFTGENYQKLEAATLEKLKNQTNQIAETQCSDEVVKNVLEQYNYFNSEQKEAVQVLTSNQNLSVLVGKAGAGKTTTMQAVAEIYKNSGARVVGMSLSAVAADNLGKEANIRSDTIAGWMYHRQLFETAQEKFLSFNEIVNEGVLKQLKWYQDLKNNEYTDFKKGDVIIVDEAGMVGTNDWHSILTLSEKTGAKIIAIGDDNQIKPISGGDCFRAVLNSTDNVGHLNTIRRQTIDWQKQASVEFSQLKTATGLSMYDNHGKIHKLTNINQIADKFVEIEKQGSAAVLCLTRKDCAEINTKIHELKVETGKLGRDLCCINSKKFNENETVIFTQNNKKIGIKNGEVATVKGFANDILTVKIGNTEKNINIKYYNHIDYAYAITINKSQGKTYDNTIVIANPIMDSKSTYVAMTRHRDNVDLYYRETDFKDTNKLMVSLSKYHAKDLVIDYSNSSNEYSMYNMNVGKYLELSDRRLTVLRNIDQGKASWNDYHKINNQKIDVGKKILENFENHKIYAEQQGLTEEKLKLQCNQMISNNEYKERAEKYINLESDSQNLLSTIKRETSEINDHYHYVEYCKLNSEKLDLVQTILQDFSKYRYVFKDLSINKSMLEQQLNNAKATQKEFLERLDFQSNCANSEKATIAELIHNSINENIDLYKENSQEHKAQIGYCMLIDNSMVQNFIRTFDLKINFNSDIAEHASMLADSCIKNSQELINVEILGECLKKAICYEKLSEINEYYGIDLSKKQLQAKAYALAEHLAEANLQILNDNDLLKEGMFAIFEPQHEINSNAVDLDKLAIDTDYSERNLEREIELSL